MIGQKRHRWFLAVLGAIPLFLFATGCGSSGWDSSRNSGEPVATASHDTETTGSRISLKVAVPVPMATDFCARIRVSGSEFEPITMDKLYPAGTSSVETVVPNIPEGPGRFVELGLFEKGVCAEFAAADWYGAAKDVEVLAGEVTIVDLALRSMKPLPSTGSIVIRGDKGSTARRLHGEVVDRNTLEPVLGAVCTVYSGPQEVAQATSGTGAANAGVLNTVVEVELDVATLSLECTHPLYQTTNEVAQRVDDPADPFFGTFIATVEMDAGPTKLPVYAVAGSALSEDTAAALVEILGLPVEILPMDEGGALRFVDPDAYQALPMVSLGQAAEDEEGEPTTAEGFDFKAIADLPVLPQADAVKRIEEALALAEALPADLAGDVQPALFVQNTLFEAFDVEGTRLARKEVDTVVSYRFKLNGLDLVGPGADVQFSLDGKGQVTQAMYALPAVQAGEMVELIPLPRATRKAKRILQRRAEAMGIPVQIQVLPPKVVYYAPDLSLKAKRLVPHYEFSGTATVGGEVVFLRTVLIPAIQGAPQITLNVAVKGDTIVANAEVAGGSGPYRYQWTSSSTELDPKASTAGPSLTYQIQPKEPINQETVGLVVTDADGLKAFASDTVDVSVAPPEPALVILPMVAGVADFGVEYVGTCGGLGGSATNASEFRSVLQNKGWTRRFYWAENSAWEQDFKDPSKPGGDDSAYADNADWVFYTGHANGNGFSFCTNDRTDGFLNYTDARWGNKDLEWITIAACGPLQQTSGGKTWAQRWGPAFDGLHLIMAYATTSYDNTIEGRRLAQWATGRPVAFFTLPPMPVRSAWILTAKESQPGSVTWAVMGVIGPSGLANYNDYIHGFGPVGPDVRGTQITGYWKLSGGS